MEEGTLIFTTDEETPFKNSCRGTSDPGLTGLYRPVRLSGEVTRIFTTGKALISVAALPNRHAMTSTAGSSRTCGRRLGAQASLAAKASNSLSVGKQRTLETKFRTGNI